MMLKLSLQQINSEVVVKDLMCDVVLLESVTGGISVETLDCCRAVKAVVDTESAAIIVVVSK